MNLEIVHSTDGMFLGYHGRSLPLPPGWQVWNAVSDVGMTIASLVASVGPPEHVDWEEADWDGPFFVDAKGGEIVAFHCVYIEPSARGRGLWLEFEEILASLELPVYATFANARLRERFRRQHMPRTTPDHMVALSY